MVDLVVAPSHKGDRLSMAVPPSEDDGAKPRSTDELLRRSLTGPGGRGWGEGA